MATANDILQIAQKEIGVKESPANSNNVKYNTWYYGKSVSGSKYPWCAVFISWIFAQIDSSLIKKSASCMDIGNWFKQQGRFKTTNPQVGDVVFFKYSTNSRWTNHIGLVEQINPDGSIISIEGNTSTSSDDNGGSVMRRTRRSNIVGYGMPKYSDDIKPSVSSASIIGIDVSAYQGNIDWQKVKNDGISFAILRGVTKNGQLDTTFDINYNNATANGLSIIGTYHFSYALNESTAVKDAENMISKLNGKKLPIYLDLEWSAQRALGKQKVTSIAKAYVNRCKELGYSCHIYSNLDWYKNVYDAKELSALGCKFWIARYPSSDNGSIKDSLRPNIEEHMWQFSSKGKVSGIIGNVDMNILYESIYEKNDYTSPSSIIKNVVRVNTSLNVRNTPNGTKVGSLKNNTQVDILDYENGWYKIGEKRWISSNYVNSTRGSVTASVLNLRSGCGTNYADIGDIPKGTTLPILSEKNGWYYTVFNKKAGWVSAKYIKLL